MSNAVIDRLRVEHTHMRSVLGVIRYLLDDVEAGRKPDSVLLSNAFYYMRKFPSVVHHPKEDMIFERLLETDDSLEHDIERLRRQHQEIYRFEDWLIDLTVEMQKTGSTVPPRLLEFGRQYLQVQREHSETEEKIIFPRALESLRASDWNRIRGKAELIEDPLFGNSVSEKYQALYDYIMRESAGT